MADETTTTNSGKISEIVNKSNQVIYPKTVAAAIID